MADALPFLISGLLLGLSGGLTPGPVTTLVITQTLRHDFGEGVKIAIAPLLTDLPIILLTLFVFSRIAAMDVVLGVVALVGGAYLLRLAREAYAAPPIVGNASLETPHSIRIGLIANILNPNPYLFWSLVGAPTLYRAIETSVLATTLFLAGMYVCLVGGKIAIAALAARGRAYLGGAGYRRTLRTLGVALALFALVFLWNGVSYLAGIP